VEIKVNEGQFVETTTAQRLDRRVSGEFIGPRGELASYAFGWVSGADSGRASVGIGAGNPGGATFHAAVFPHDGEIAYALVDEPFETVPQGGPHLTAVEAREHEDLPFIWAVVDAVMALDSRAGWLRHCVLGTASIATAGVLAGEEPVLYVSHDGDDGMWQFIGTSDATIENGRIGHLHHAVELDATLIEVLNLEPGEHATRTHVGGAWTRSDANGRRRRRGPFGRR
jgi:hypothetical protein